MVQCTNKQIRSASQNASNYLHSWYLLHGIFLPNLTKFETEKPNLQTAKDCQQHPSDMFDACHGKNFTASWNHDNWLSMAREFQQQYPRNLLSGGDIPRAAAQQISWVLLPPNCDQSLNTLSPRWNGRFFVDNIFTCIFLNENVWISIEISLKFAPNGPINTIPSLVQIMVWRPSGTKPLSEPMMVYWCIYASLGLNELNNTHWSMADEVKSLRPGDT